MASSDEVAAARNNQNNILAAKVARALEVRSDTPAMKAALESLSHLPDHQDDLFSVDSRSVRVAIEYDALQQALLLQRELQSLLETVGALRNGISETAAIARRVEEAIHMNVVTASGDFSGSSLGAGTSADSETSNQLRDGPVDQALATEQKLASILNEAFLERNAARKRVEAVHTFLEKFDLSEEDSRLLDHYAFEDVEASNVNGMAFLSALERVRIIRKELGRTFGTLDILHNQQSSLSEGTNESNRLGASSALRMMEALAQKQERAYERLYHWLQKHLNVDGQEVPFSDEDDLDEALAHPYVRRSLYTLRNVPAFYSHLLDLIAASRRSEETRRFLLALTSGYQGCQPIEMRAHDSVVYVGDMLAFCFRAFSVEADVARGLIDYVPDSEVEGQEEGKEDSQSATEEEEYGIEKAITSAEMLSQSMGGVSRPLKARILHVIASLSRRYDEDDDSDDDMDVEEEGLAARGRLSQLYEICGLLLFYISAVAKAMAKLQTGKLQEVGVDEDGTTESNPLMAAMLDCLGEAASAFEASLRVYGAMLGHLNVITGDSEASLAHAMIGCIVDVRKASPGFTSDVECPPAHRKTLALDWACDAMIEAALPACKSLDDTVTLSQSISIARQADLLPEVATSLQNKVRSREAALIDDLVDRETVDVLDLCGLGALVTAFQNFQGVHVEGMVMAAHPGLTPEEVKLALNEFYSSLYSPPLPSFESTIKDPTLRKLARSKIAQKVCSKYETLYENMTRLDKGGYDDLTFLGHTPRQVNTLFTV
jgi:conserved oligomeric Golgi complex subunit 6